MAHSPAIRASMVAAVSDHAEPPSLVPAVIGQLGNATGTPMARITCPDFRRRDPLRVARPRPTAFAAVGNCPVGDHQGRASWARSKTWLGAVVAMAASAAEPAARSSRVIDGGVGPVTWRRPAPLAPSAHSAAARLLGEGSASWGASDQRDHGGLRQLVPAIRPRRRSISASRASWAKQQSAGLSDSKATIHRILESFSPAPCQSRNPAPCPIYKICFVATIRTSRDRRNLGSYLLS